MRRIAISGPHNVPVNLEETITADFLGRITDDDIVYTGGAYGIDTLGAVAARALGARFILVAPVDCWYNKALHDIATDVIEVEGSYMERNDELADHADELIAYPRTDQEELRSGTWATIRRFRKLDKPVTIRPFDVW